MDREVAMNAELLFLKLFPFVSAVLFDQFEDHRLGKWKRIWRWISKAFQRWWKQKNRFQKQVHLKMWCQRRQRVRVRDHAWHFSNFAAWILIKTRMLKNCLRIIRKPFDFWNPIIRKFPWCTTVPLRTTDLKFNFGMTPGLIIMLTGTKAAECPIRIRRKGYPDPQTGQNYLFLTNIFHLSARTYG